MEPAPVLGIIGGSGLYDFPGMEDVRSVEVDTPFGKPSGPVVLGKLEGKPVAFLARHGAGHVLLPGEVNYRANIYAFKALGVQRIVSVSACGSLREDFAPGDIVIPDQIFDFTRNRERTFFGQGIVAHIGVADPLCPDLSEHLYRSAAMATSSIHRGANFIVIEGPRFSTRAESNLYRAWGMELIGMTSAPEAFLVREAEMCYAIMAHVTDYDVWRVSEEPVTVEMVENVLAQNTQIAQQAIRLLVRNLPDERNCDCGHALENAIITQPASIPTETRQKLDLIVGKYLPS